MFEIDDTCTSKVLLRISRNEMQKETTRFLVPTGRLHLITAPPLLVPGPRKVSPASDGVRASKEARCVCTCNLYWKRPDLPWVSPTPLPVLHNHKCPSRLCSTGY